MENKLHESPPSGELHFVLRLTAAKHFQSKMIWARQRDRDDVFSDHINIKFSRLTEYFNGTHSWHSQSESGNGITSIRNFWVATQRTDLLPFSIPRKWLMDIPDLWWNGGCLPSSKLWLCAVYVYVVSLFIINISITMYFPILPRRRSFETKKNPTEPDKKIDRYRWRGSDTGIILRYITCINKYGSASGLNTFALNLGRFWTDGISNQMNSFIGSVEFHTYGRWCWGFRPLFGIFCE